MNPKRISRWQASASLSSDFGAITFEFDDGSHTPISNPIPAARLAAVIAVLESSQAAYFSTNPKGEVYVSNTPNAPGPGVE